MNITLYSKRIFCKLKKKTMLTNKVEKALNKQIEIEANSSQYYLAMASWAETKGFEGVAAGDLIIAISRSEVDR